VRAAFELALDRQALNQVVYEGMYIPTAQPLPPGSPYHVRGLQPEPRNLDRARALLREAGLRAPVPVEMAVPNNPDLRQAAEVIQAMVREAGFELRISAVEFASGLQASVRGEFELWMVGWSGRVDPDGNAYIFMHSRGPQNDGRYANPEVDRLLDETRRETDVERRKALYERIFDIAIRQDRSRIYLWHRKQIVAHTARLSGFLPVPDGLIRPQGLRLQ